MSTDNRPIGVLDSGLGGISVLRELVKLMPGEDFIYYGDSANAPYGTRTPEEVIDLTKKDVEFLLERGAKAIVVACNTATSVAIKELRAAYEEVLPVIGIEPALKPAVKAKEHSKVVVMATPMTLSQTKFNSMMHIYEDDANIIKMPCPGLVEYIESGVLDGPVLDAYLEKQFAPYDKAEIDAVVLGCTHYPLIREVIQKHLPGVFVYDGGFGTAKQTKRRLAERGLLSDRESGGKVEIFNSRNTEKILELSRRLLNM
ncbi:glutamate racemase [Clostridium sp. AF12-19]|nr:MULTISPECIES: glutamate racemase [unclassified Clostridium]RHS25100.1 glutamate racemase [Clostridium sp. AF12-28]RHS28768.1 glutamate racemase [Clostridium sp. AF12-19]